MKDHVRADWSGAILVCGKCSKKIGGAPLAKALRRAIGDGKGGGGNGGGGKGRRAAIGVVETKCLGICPKRAVVVVDSARPERWEIVPEGTTADAVLARLGRG